MRNQIVGFKPTVGLTSRAGVIPESENQDSVGTFGRTVRDAVLALDAIYGPDELDARTMDQQGPKGGFEKLLSKKDVLRGANFGLPRQSFLDKTDDETRDVLLNVVRLLESSGAKVWDTEISNHKQIVSPTGWDWDFDAKPRSDGTKMSEYTYIKVDFFNNINDYLKKLKVSPMRSLEHIVNYNKLYSGSEGGFPQSHPAFYSGQDGLEAALATGGRKDDIYEEALSSRQSSARQGIDEALHNRQLNGLLVPLEPGQSYQIAAQAGYPMITLPVGVHADSGMGIGLGIMHTAWRDDELVRFGSAIEDLLSSTQFKRTLPTWRGARERNLPIPL